MNRGSYWEPEDKQQLRVKNRELDGQWGPERAKEGVGQKPAALRGKGCSGRGGDMEGKKVQTDSGLQQGQRRPAGALSKKV